MGIWGEARRRAWIDTREHLGVGSMPKFLLTFLPATGGGGAYWLVEQRPAIAAIAALGLLIALNLLIFLISWATAPARMLRDERLDRNGDRARHEEIAQEQDKALTERQEQIDNLERKLARSERKRHQMDDGIQALKQQHNREKGEWAKERNELRREDSRRELAEAFGQLLKEVREMKARYEEYQTEGPTDEEFQALKNRVRKTAQADQRFATLLAEDPKEDEFEIPFGVEEEQEAAWLTLAYGQKS